MTDYFTADNHYGHETALRWRPFGTVDEMDDAMAHDWNDRVKPGDRVFVLGDFSMYKLDKTNEILRQLNGQKFLIKGNHDSSKLVNKMLFTKVSTYEELSFDTPAGKQKIVMSHFPFLSWNRMHYGSYHLHGHSHGSLRLPEALQNARIFDVGIDNTSKIFGHMGPISLDEVLALLEGKGPASTDHHEPKSELTIYV